MRIQNNEDKKALKSMEKRILEISYKYGLSHLGSCFSALPIIYEICKTSKDTDRFVLSSGHAGLALYVVLEQFYQINAEMLFIKHGVHPNRDVENKIDCSSGSLGQGLPIALGMALAKRSYVGCSCSVNDCEHRYNIHCLISDGECAEGSIWEALTIAENQGVQNLKIHVNCNGWGAYDPIDLNRLVKRLSDFHVQLYVHYTTVERFSFLKGQSAHYHVMSEQDYQSALKHL